MMNNSTENAKIIVSLTSFPEAIPYAVQAIKSVLRGTLLPDKVVLYLDTWKFPEGILPPELESLVAENPIVEVRFDPRDIRSYKKLVPALSDFPEDVIVTIDDDISYPSDMLSRLVKMHKHRPNAIIAHRARKVRPELPYSRWRKYKFRDFIFRKHHFGYRILQTGVGGVLYPPHSLDEEMLRPELFMQMAPTCDDIWFWAAAVSKGTYVVPVPGWHPRAVDIGKPREFSLKTVNLKPGDDRNRKAMDAICAHFPAIKRRIEYGK